MEQYGAGLVQGNEGLDNTVETTKFGSGLHESAEFAEPTSVEGDSVPEAVSGEPEGPAEVVKPEQQAFIGDDGQVHQVPPELIGPDGKMLPFNERTMRILRNRYFTIRHDLMPCGHKIDRINQPKTNCEICWWNWLNTHSQLVQTAHEFYQQYGKDRLVKMRGKVFVRMFLRFMSTVNHLLEEQKVQEKLNDNQQGQSNSDSGASVRSSEGDQGRPV